MYYNIVVTIQSRRVLGKNTMQMQKATFRDFSSKELSCSVVDLFALLPRTVDLFALLPRTVDT